MKEQSSWLYYEEVDAAVDTLIALVETTGGLSLAYVESLKQSIKQCRNPRFVQTFFTGIRKRKPNLLYLFVDFVPDGPEG